MKLTYQNGWEHDFVNKYNIWDCPEDEYLNDYNREVMKIANDETNDTAKDSRFEDFAKIAMRELTDNGIDDLVLLKHDKLRVWWAGVMKKERAEQDRIEAAKRKSEVTKQALSKLNDEEKKALGLLK